MHRDDALGRHAKVIYEGLAQAFADREDACCPVICAPLALDHRLELSPGEGCHRAVFAPARSLSRVGITVKEEPLFARADVERGADLEHRCANRMCGDGLARARRAQCMAHRTVVIAGRPVRTHRMNRQDLRQ